MTHILDHEFLTTKDVSMAPGLGQLPSRSLAEVEPFIYSAPMDTVTGYQLTKTMLEAGEYPVVSRFISYDEKWKIVEELGTHPNTFFAIGTGDDAVDFLNLLADVGAAQNDWEGEEREIKFNVAIDIAHGDMVAAHELATFLREKPFIRYIMSGSICTPDAAVRALRAGCSHLRVGVGPGAACTTRVKTGVGIPNLSAVYLIDKNLKAWGRRNAVRIIADGGITEPGDAVKYLCGGADAIMMGSVFSKARESAGWHAMEDPRFFEEVRAAAAAGKPIAFPLPDPPVILVKRFRGQASAEFQEDMFGKVNRCPEGASSDPFYWDEYTTVETILEEYRGGLASSISYQGHIKSVDLGPESTIMIKVSAAGYREGTPHGV
jgi:IMP dehydrogenase